MNVYASLPLIEALAAELAPFRDEDEKLFFDTLDAGTPAMDLLDAAIEAEQSDRAAVRAIAERIATLRARAERIEMRADAHRRAMMAILRAMDVRKVERPQVTLSVRPGSVSVKIIDEDSIPTQLLTVKTTTAPDKKAIRAQIEAGETVPGAELARGDDILMVKVA